MTTNMHNAEWECLYPDIDWFRDTHLPALFSSLHPVHKTSWIGPEPLVSGYPADVISILCEPSGSLRHLAVVLTNSTHKKNFAHVLCPFAADAAEVEVMITSITERTAGLEAVVTGEWENRSVPFLDPLYHINRDRYRIGEKQRVRMAALCFDVRAQRATSVVFDDPEQEEHVRHRLGIPPGEPVNISMVGMVARLPGDDDPEYASFTSPVKDLKTVTANGFTLLRAVVALARDENDLDVPMFIPAHIAANYPALAPGVTADGINWVQGTLAETHALITAAGAH